MGWLNKLLQATVEDELADLVVDDHRGVIVEAYDRARADGASEHEAALAACRRMITHAL